MTIYFLDGRMHGLAHELPRTTARIPPGTPFYARDAGLTFVASQDGWRLQGARELVSVARVAALAHAPLLGLYFLDGVDLADGSVVLLTGQDDAADNGLWIARDGVWSRDPNYVGVARGDRVVVARGEHGAGHWVVTGDTPTLAARTDALYYVRSEGRKVFGSGRLLRGATTVRAHVRSGAVVTLTPRGAPVVVGAVTPSSIDVMGTGDDEFFWEVTNPS